MMSKKTMTLGIPSLQPYLISQPLSQSWGLTPMSDQLYLAGSKAYKIDDVK